MKCPACGRPVAVARPSCLYCGVPLPAELVAQATAAASAPAALSPRPPDSLASAGAGDRVLVVARFEATADVDRVAEALDTTTYEAQQRVRRGGWQWLRSAAPEDGASDHGRLVAAGLDARLLPESAVRAVQPLVATGGQRVDGALQLRTTGADLTLVPDDVRLVVKAPIVREYQTSATVKRVRMATLDPGYRFHLHRRGDAPPVELDPAEFQFRPANPEGGSLLQISAWVEALFGSAELDDDFRRLPPVLGPAEAPAVDLAQALGARGRAPDLKAQRGTPNEAQLTLDNVAQFRFFSAWRGMVDQAG